jgi:CheY-like chemotaxis protein
MTDTTQATRTALVVDDDYSVLELLQDLLKRKGYDLHLSSSGTVALADFKNTPDAFDVVITDYKMPDMDGCSFAKALRVIKPDTKIILITGYDLGINDLPDNVPVFIKPLDIAAFYQALEN